MEEFFYSFFRENQQAVYASLFTISLLTALFAYRWGFRKFKSIVPNIDDRKYYLNILTVYIGLNIVSSLLWLPSPIDDVLRGPFSLVIHVLPLFVVIRFISRKHSNLKHLDLMNIRNQEDLNRHVMNILNEENFLTALRSTLPKGEKDPDYGLDYVPYMLKNIEERRERFRKRANQFLVTSVAVGFIFVAITVTLGYFILQDDSIGAGREIRLVKEQLVSIDEKMEFLNKNLLSRTAAYKTIQRDASQLENLIAESVNEKLPLGPGDPPRPPRMKFKADDLATLEMQLDTLLLKYTNIPDVDMKAGALRNDVRSVQRSSVQSIEGLPAAITRVGSLVDDASKELNKSENRTPDVIKRLILSVVIVSFLIAILRFLTNQYKRNYNELIAADSEDLYVRKTYIALKTAGGDTESKKIIINLLLARMRNESEAPAGEEAEKYGIVKDIIETLAKKL